MKTKIILVSAKARNGKDTFAEYLKLQLEKKGKVVLIDHFAKYIKGYCRQMGWQGDKDDYWRTKLQLLGTEIIKEQLNYKCFHAKRMCEDIQILTNTFDIDYIIIPDTRFKDEIFTIASYFPNDYESVRVNRIDFESDLTDEQKKHKSECDLDDYDFKNVFNVTTIESLYRLIDKYIERIEENEN